MNVPPWLKLLTSKERRWTTGPTIAFLVGAVRSPIGLVVDDASGYDELVALLESMRDGLPSNKWLAVAQCSTLGEPVFALSAYANATCRPVLHLDGSPSRLSAWPDYLAAGRDLCSLAYRLWQLVGPHINEGRFSFRQNRYEPFDEDELNFIKRALEVVTK